MKHRILFLVSLTICGLFSSSSTCAQTVELPALVSGQELESIKGSTVNRSNTTGGSSSLTVGSSTTFGASANLNASPGTKSSSSSSLNSMLWEPMPMEFKACRNLVLLVVVSGHQLGEIIQLLPGIL